MSIIKIALTGGIACGKSKASQLLSGLGVDVISLDELARDVVKPNTFGLKELVKYFGNDILLNADKSLNRGALRKLLLESKSNQLLIEAVLHPEILVRMQTAINKLESKLVVVEIPLLAEKNLTHLFNRAIIVECNEEQQLKRLIARDNINLKEAKSMISTQTSHSLRLELCDKLPVDVIENNLDIADLTQKTNQLYKKLINL
ncbi:dephospho-CoA kinase [Abyssogena phaseoliformis symbiont OG214]|uniref:dephospho-CoA kinase n=1 Tax=Abyssogena phaseoliformis symbiont TaxID=596095 RepID=UPI00191578F1|nr:dephospho-CoA kinase [Abyssogena phaseoliformis symbiont]MBW5288565.1 Dephospho-CoA kinase [Candidatus Ruthia sp. Apha_13_S6]BBB23267.1 dephospho-CoA kinase [Abyssogena phaseoliformis symbiont OG214]